MATGSAESCGCAELGDGSSSDVTEQAPIDQPARSTFEKSVPVSCDASPDGPGGATRTRSVGLALSARHSRLGLGLGGRSCATSCVGKRCVCDNPRLGKRGLAPKGLDFHWSTAADIMTPRAVRPSASSFQPNPRVTPLDAKVRLRGASQTRHPSRTTSILGLGFLATEAPYPTYARRASHLGVGDLSDDSAYCGCSKAACECKPKQFPSPQSAGLGATTPAPSAVACLGLSSPSRVVRRKSAPIATTTMRFVPTSEAPARYTLKSLEPPRLAASASRLRAQTLTKSPRAEYRSLPNFALTRHGGLVARRDLPALKHSPTDVTSETRPQLLTSRLAASAQYASLDIKAPMLAETTPSSYEYPSSTVSSSSALDIPFQQLQMLPQSTSTLINRLEPPRFPVSELVPRFPPSLGIRITAKHMHGPERHVGVGARDLLGRLGEICVPDNCSYTMPADWNEAFRSQPQSDHDWSGSDAAYSVRLPDLNGMMRTLWIFGDSNIGFRTNCQATYYDLVAQQAAHCYDPNEKVEDRCTLWSLFGNTIAVQTHLPGQPASHDQLQFYWGPGGTGSCLKDAGRKWSDEWYDDKGVPEYGSGAWLPVFPPLRAALPDPQMSLVNWPGHGIVIGDDLLLINLPLDVIESTNPNKPFFVRVHLGIVATKVPGVSRPYEEWTTPQRRVVPSGEIGTGEMTKWSVEPTQELIPFTKPGWYGADPFGGFNPFVSWGLCFVEDPDAPGTIYIYGTRQRPEFSSGGSSSIHDLIVAKADNIQSVDDLMAFNWQFWNGQNWVDNPEDAIAELDRSGLKLAPRLFTGEFSIVRAPDRAGSARKWALVHGLDSIQVAFAPNPWGPFEARFAHDLRECGYYRPALVPRLDAILDGGGAGIDPGLAIIGDPLKGTGDDNPLRGFGDYEILPTGPIRVGRQRASAPKLPLHAYAIKAHPHLSDDRNLLVSFIVNPIVPGAVLEDDTTYVPRFLSIPWDRLLQRTCQTPNRTSNEAERFLPWPRV